MSRVWRIRLVIAGAAWLIVDGLMVAAGMEPRHLMLAVIVMAGSTVCWLVYDLAGDVQAADWEAVFVPPPTGTGSDARVSRIKLRLYDENSPRHAGRLHPALVELVDDRLASRHGIDRSRDPAAARAVMGEALHRFVVEPPGPRELSDPRSLDRVLTLIEKL